MDNNETKTDTITRLYDLATKVENCVDTSNEAFIILKDKEYLGHPGMSLYGPFKAFAKQIADAIRDVAGE